LQAQLCACNFSLNNASWCSPNTTLQESSLFLFYLILLCVDFIIKNSSSFLSLLQNTPLCGYSCSLFNMLLSHGHWVLQYLPLQILPQGVALASLSSALVNVYHYALWGEKR
jgi:hypothetical protein